MASTIAFPSPAPQESPLDLARALSAARLTSGEITRAPRPLSAVSKI